MIGMWCLAAAICVQNSPDEMADALALLDRLDSTIVSVDYRNEKLQVVLDDLTTRLPAPFRADWPSLERLGIDPDDRVTFAAPHASAAATLAGLMLTTDAKTPRPLQHLRRHLRLSRPPLLARLERNCCCSSPITSILTRG